MKILVASDNHFNKQALKDIVNIHQDCDMYLHCGDSDLSPVELKPFVAVKGNNDFFGDFPKFRVIDTPKHSFYITHGHLEGCDYRRMGENAKKAGCDIVLYGHTHIYDDTIEDGIRFINPGSLSHNRDYTTPCYALITIDDKTGEMDVKRIDLKITK